jgi:hypothetical protein
MLRGENLILTYKDGDTMKNAVNGVSIHIQERHHRMLLK